jgi:membrane fusion protein (multidrug efflux system)
MSESDYIRYRDRLSHLEQRDLVWARKQFAKLESGGVTEEGDPGVDLVLADGSTYAHRGVIVTANRQIDATTGTIQIQALLPNPDGSLRPGAYGQVRIKRREAGHDVLVVPERALVSVQGTYSVGVVGPDSKVKLHRVEVGPSVQGLRVVISGVEEGDKIVVDGVQKISDGALVDPKPAPPAASASAPAPVASAAPSSKN